MDLYCINNLLCHNTEVTTQVDHCSSSPCKNGGLCISNQQGYSCYCSGWYGNNCEIGKLVNDFNYIYSNKPQP
jgi:hypothetical protein